MSTYPVPILAQLGGIGEGQTLPTGRPAANFAAPGTQLSGLIVGRSGTQSLVRILGQDFLLQLPKRWPSDVQQLSLIYLGGQEQAKFLLLQPQAQQSLPKSSLSLLTQTLFASAVGEGAAPAALSLPRLDPAGQQFSTLLAASLQQGVENSGLFYEGHLKAWAQGNYPLQRLLQEPQGRLSPLLSGENVGRTLLQGSSPIFGTTETPSWQGQQALGAYTQVAALSAALSPALPSSLQPLLQQQGQALLQQQMLWTFSPWPGQSVSWSIGRRQEDSRGGHAEQEEQGASWDSRVQLDLPAMGKLDAHLRIRADALHMRIRATPSVLALLQARKQELLDALQAYGLHPQVTVEEASEQAE